MTGSEGLMELAEITFPEVRVVNIAPLVWFRIPAITSQVEGVKSGFGGLRGEDFP